MIDIFGGTLLLPREYKSDDARRGEAIGYPQFLREARKRRHRPHGLENVLGQAIDQQRPEIRLPDWTEPAVNVLAISETPRSVIEWLEIAADIELIFIARAVEKRAAQ